MSFDFDNTIAAISSPIGVGWIGIVRMSGKDALNILSKVFVPADSKKVVSEIESHTVTYGHIVDDGKTVDEVLAIVMLAPKTYTRENVVEINCHGGIKVIKSVLNTLVKNGADIAEPGEFTKRAFLNGRIDLSQAEAVIDLINAKTELSERASINRLEGRLSKKVQEIRDQILTMTAHIEAGIDYPEHDDETFTSQFIFDKTNDVIEVVQHLIDTADVGKIIKEGIKTVILGKPNVGKSSLMNCLIDEDRAIVTDIPGTTRDILEENINIKGVPLNIIDTAGIRETDDIIEKIGVEKSKDYAKIADFIFFVIDGSRPLEQEDFEILQFIKDNNKKAIVIINKSDLEQKITINDILKYIDESYVLNISVKQNLGVNDLFDKIKELFFNGEIDINDEAIVSNERNKASLLKAKSSLSNVIDTVQNQMPQDFISMDLMDAYSYLGEIIGETVDEDVIDKIFSEFCLGK